MKSESFILSTHKARENAIQRIKSDPCDGKTQVTIGPVGTKSARQRGLFFKWCTEVADSGMGGEWEATKAKVHIYAKKEWALPILQRDNIAFASLYDAWINKHPGNEIAIWWFCNKIIHTEEMSVSQNAEILTEMQRYYQSVGIYLTHPDDRGLLT